MKTYFKTQRLFCGFVIFLFAVNAYAATIHGTVIDPLGAVVADARVDLLSGDKVIASTNTDSEGNYEFQNLPAGRFHLHAVAVTFSPTDTDSFYVSSTATTIQHILVQAPNISQEVVVTATGVPTSEAKVGASVSVLNPADYLNQLDVIQPLRSAPGLQLTQTGQRGGTTSLFIRGGNSDANKVLIDGVPANDIGGNFEFGDLSATSFDRIEIFRGPNSILYGSDALAGVVSLTTRHGVTSLPELTYSADGGNFGTYRQEGTLGGAWHQLDYFSSFARFDTSNSLPNSAFHNGTYTGNFGWSPSAVHSVRLTVRRLGTALGLPNAIDFFGIADNAQQRDHDTFISATYQNQATAKWHNLVRYGASRLDSKFNKPSPVGLFDGFEFLGAPVTIRGANGFRTTGQAFFSSADCCPESSVSTANRDSVYAQTDYSFTPHLISLVAYRYEAERGDSASRSPGFSSHNSVDRRNMSFILETHGDLQNKLFYSVGGSIEKNQVFGFEPAPRVSFAYYPVRPSSGLLRGTKLKFDFGTGIKEPSIFEETSSLFDLLRKQPGGDQLVQKFGIKPIGAVRSRSYDFGVEQSLTDHVQINVTLFHNHFSNVVEFIDSPALPFLGVSPNVVALSGFGATVNSSDFRTQGVESEIDFKISQSLSARAGYTYLDGKVERSFANAALCSTGLDPCFNPDFPGVPIGAFSALPGARPFRRAPHSGFLSVVYSRSRWSALFQGTFVGRRDDSTFLLFSDANFGNSLLLPNRNLDSAYQKLDLSGDFRLTNYLTLYTSMENLLSQRYDAAFGFPALPFTVRSGIKITLGGESWRHK